MTGEDQVVTCGSAHQCATSCPSTRIAAGVKGDTHRVSRGVKCVITCATVNRGDSQILCVKTQRDSHISG